MAQSKELTENQKLQIKKYKERTMSKEKIKLFEDPLPMWYYDADGCPHRYDKILFIHDLVKKLNEVIKAVNEIASES